MYEVNSLNSNSRRCAIAVNVVELQRTVALRHNHFVYKNNMHGGTRDGNNKQNAL